jgi:hypothetical protein
MEQDKQPNQELTLDFCRNVAGEKHIECLSTTFVDKDTDMTWGCKNGHTWEATFHDFYYNKSGCKKCRDSVGKTSTRLAVMDFFGFTDNDIVCDVRKDVIPWLLGLKLDIYVPSMKLAIEYDKIQHTEFVPGIHKTIERYECILRNNTTKDDLCITNNTTLIRIPHNVKIREYLFDKLIELGFKTELSRSTFIGDPTFWVRVYNQCDSITKHIDRIKKYLRRLKFDLITPFAKGKLHEVSCNMCRKNRKCKIFMSSTHISDIYHKEQRLCSKLHPVERTFAEIKYTIEKYNFKLTGKYIYKRQPQGKLLKNWEVICVECGLENYKLTSKLKDSGHKLGSMCNCRKYINKQ